MDLYRGRIAQNKHTAEEGTQTVIRVPLNPDGVFGFYIIWGLSPPDH